MFDLSFSPIYSASIEYTENVTFSPDGKYVSFVQNDNTIFVLDSKTRNVFCTLICPSKIEQYSWSPDGTKLLALMVSLNEMYIYKVEQPPAPDKIAPPLASSLGGFIDTERVIWSPNSRYVLLFGIKSIHLILWDYNKGTYRKLHPPKNNESSIAFSKSGRLFALISRGKACDVCSIYTTSEFMHKTSFELSTVDCQHIFWSPDEAYCVAVDHMIHNLIQILNITTGRITDYSSCVGHLGIETLSINPNSKIIAIGTFDSTLRLLVQSEYGWTILSECLHDTSFSASPLNVYVEKNNTVELVELPYTIKDEDLDKERFGIRNIEWSISGNLVATVPERAPKSVFIWDTKTMSPDILIFEDFVHDLKWSPVDDTLLVGSGTTFLTVWSSKKTFTVPLPDDFNVHYLMFNKDASSTVLVDNNRSEFVVADLIL